MNSATIVGKIEAEEFCNLVVKQPSLREFRLIPDQILEILGSLSNLYLEVGLVLGQPRVRIDLPPVFGRVIS